MKKNTMMRLASALLVLVLLTTCAISGTFAKYVVAGSGTDTARVAKWGVDIAITTGSSFDTEYEAHDDEYTAGVTVKADTKVVAPGTSSADVDGDVTFTITGTPEVAAKVVVEFEADNEIKLAPADYLDYTTANNKTDKFTLTEEYYPVKFTLTKDGTAVVTDGTLADVAEELSSTSSVAPGTPLDATYVLTWKWDFNGNDKADTYLGNENPLQTLGYTINVSVTQID